MAAQGLNNMSTVAHPPTAMPKCGQRKDSANQRNFMMQYEQHLNDNLAHYQNPEAHHGLSQDLFQNTRASPSGRGRRFWCGIVLWSIVVLSVMCVGGLSLAVGVRRQKSNDPSETANESTLNPTAVHTIKPTASISSSGNSLAFDISAKEAPRSSHTATLSAEISSIQPISLSTTSLTRTSAAMITSNGSSSMSRTEMQSTTAYITSETALDDPSRKTTTIISIPSPSTPLAVATISTSVLTESLSATLGDSLDVSSASEHPAASSTISSFVPSSIDTSHSQAAQTSNGGLIGFCGTRGMACTEKMKRNLDNAENKPVAIAILESALATFSVMYTTSKTEVSEMSKTTRSHSTRIAETSQLTTARLTMVSIPTPAPISSSETVESVSSASLHTVAPVVGFCSVRGMACLRQKRNGQAQYENSGQRSMY
nr:hypothetical protein CFP56_57552 [Quercus suber]